jgi:LPS-assembly protein
VTAGRWRSWRGWGAVTALTIALLTGAPVVGQGVGAQTPDDVLLTAETLTYNEELGVVTASGNVELSRDERILRADTLSYNRRADLVTASGNVALMEPSGDVLFADYMELTGDLKSGAIAGIRVLMSDDSRFAANGGRLTSDGRTVMSKAVYSPCKLCEDDPDRAPIWQIKAFEVTHDKKLRRIFYSDAFLEVFGVPVLYVPFFSHPDPTVVRKTGFLPPSFGSNSVLGFTYTQPYFFNISPSQDATLEPIITSDEGVVLIGEYRQVTETGQFTVDGSVTRASAPPEEQADDKKTRGHISTQGKFAINPGWAWGFDVNRASDATYLARYGFQRGENTLTSDVYIEGLMRREYAGVRALSFQSLDPDVDESGVPYVLPLADYSFKSEPSRYGDYWLLDANVMVLGRSEGPQSRRLSVTGGWRLPYVAPAGDVYTLTVSARGDVYNVADVPDPTSRTGESQDGFTGRAVPQVMLDWRYPFARSSGGWSQVIEPIVQLIASPNGGNPSKIPNEDSLEFEFDDINLFSDNRFSGLDRVEGGARANYGLKLSALGGEGHRSEVVIGQSFRIQDDDTFEEGTGLDDNFSDIVGRITVSPASFLDLGYRFRLDKTNLAARRSQLLMSVGPTWLRGTVNYIKLSDEPTTGVPSSEEQIHLVGKLRIDENWSFVARHQRDLTADGGSLFTSFGLNYEDDCVFLTARFDRNFTQNRDIEASTNFTIRVTLKHLG